MHRKVKVELDKDIKLKLDIKDDADFITDLLNHQLPNLASLDIYPCEYNEKQNVMVHQVFEQIFPEQVKKLEIWHYNAANGNIDKYMECLEYVAGQVTESLVISNSKISLSNIKTILEAFHHLKSISFKQ